VRVVREDPERRGLLYAGTEFGMYVSFNDGARWQRLQLNLPVSPVTDAKVHRGDLVVSTQGRSFWVLDDLTPLRELAAAPSVAAVQLFTPRAAARGVVGAPLREVDLTLPDDLPHGALIHFTLAREARTLALEVRDAAGTVLRTWRADTGAVTPAGGPTGAGGGSRTLTRTSGLHRVVWDLRGPGPQGGGGQGVKMPPGTYTVRIVADGTFRERPLVITGNPRAPYITQADYEAQHALSIAVRDTISAINAAVAQIRQQPDSVRARLADIEGALVPVRAPGSLVAPARLLSHYGTLYGTLVGDGGYGSGSAEGRPGEGVVARKADLDAQWNAIRAELAARMAGGPPPN